MTTTPAEITSQHVASGLAILSAAYDQYRSSRDRDAIYPYLKAVYSFVIEVRPRHWKIARQMMEVAQIDHQVGEDVFTMIIKSTSNNETPQAIFKWKTCLRKAYVSKIQAKDLKKTIEHSGGINDYSSD